MPLQELVPGSEPDDVQKTTFSVDAVARYTCSTWQEATGTGGPFSAIVIGAGMYGAYLATKVFRRHAQKRVLVLDAGRFMVSEHLQNLAQIDINAPDIIAPAHDPGPKKPRALVWGIPWRGNVSFPGLAYCLGGKSIYWGGWSPRLTAGDLQAWPAALSQYLNTNYVTVESETGVRPHADFIFGELPQALFNELTTVTAAVATIDTSVGTNGVEVAPLAVQGSPPDSGLFSFDKFSSLPLLLEAVRDDVRASNYDDSKRRLFLVPRAHVVRLNSSGGAITGVELDVAGERKYLGVGSETAVVLAASAIESTRLALDAVPSPLMGRNLMAHLRSDFTVRIKRSAFPPLPTAVQTAALLVRGITPAGRYHLQVTASTHAAGSDELLFRMIPDMDNLEAQLSNKDPNWITITFRAIGEMRGDKTSAIHGPTTCWMDLSPYERDEFGIPRAYVHLVLNQNDAQVWNAMDEAVLALTQALAKGSGNIEYRYDGDWQTQPFPLSRSYPEWHRGLGSTYHESGTLWMGDTPNTSVTNAFGRMHHVNNLYACDQSLFPTVGSVNPVLTGLTLARRMAEHISSLN